MKPTENQLRDEMILRQASLEDARRELEAGELTPIQAATIEAREELALMRIHRELDDLASGVTKKRQGRQRRTSFLVVGLVCLLTVVVIILWHSLSLRQAGAQDTGNVSLSRSQEVTQYLTEAQNDIAGANVSAALQAYQYVLQLDPKNVEALTETGWLDFSAGSSAVDPSLVSIGETDLANAIRYGPDNAGARLYYAIAADTTPGHSNKKLATSEFKIFLALHPSADQLAVAKKYLVALGLPTS